MEASQGVPSLGGPRAEVDLVPGGQAGGEFPDLVVLSLGVLISIWGIRSSGGGPPAKADPTHVLLHLILFLQPHRMYCITYQLGRVQ